MNLRCGCAVLAALVCGVAATVARAQKELLAETLGFSFEMPRDAVTSAGVYDPAGHLIKLLWTMQPLTAGKQVGQWDRANELGQQVAAGHYEYHVVVNPSTYENIGTVGNGGPTPDVLGHMPDCLEGVAVDETGAIYTANNWDEAGSDFKKWDADGKPIYHADYQIRNGHPNGVPHALAVDQEYLYCTMGGWEDDHNKAEQQVQRFRRSDGQAVKFTKTGREDGHINVYEWPKKHIPPGTPAADAALMGLPLQAIAVAGHELVVADALGGRILRFDKETGEATGEFATPLPHALAVDGQGRLWVGQQHHRVAVYSLDGKLLRDVLTDVGDLANFTSPTSRRAR